MIFDKELSFCFNTSLDKVATAAAVLGDVIDLWEGAPGATPIRPLPPVGGPLTNLHDVFAGNQSHVVGIITSPLTQATGSVQFDLVTADAAPLTGNAVTLWSSGALVQAITAVAGYRLRIPTQFSVPLGRQRYLGWLYTVTTTTVSGGAKFTSGLVWNVQDAPGSFA